MKVYCPTLLQQWGQMKTAGMKVLLAYKKLKDVVAKQNPELN